MNTFAVQNTTIMKADSIYGIGCSVVRRSIFWGSLILVMYSCNHAPAEDLVGNADEVPPITEQEILGVQQAWGEGIVRIGTIYMEKGDYRAAAEEHIRTFYHYDHGPVLFKPTLASAHPFRTDFEGALSYFVGGDEYYQEDHGFAIKPWSGVRWDNIGTHIHGNMAVAMGQYFFTPAKGGDEVQVEYSFAYTRDEDGALKIILHDSHLPYRPADNH